MLRIAVIHAADPVVVKQLDLRAGKGHHDGRMRRDDELGILPDQIVHGHQQRQQPLRRQRRLRLVQQVQAAALKAVLHQGKKRLPVGALVQGF